MVGARHSILEVLFTKSINSKDDHVLHTILSPHDSPVAHHVSAKTHFWPTAGELAFSEHVLLTKRLLSNVVSHDSSPLKGS